MVGNKGNTKKNLRAKKISDTMKRKHIDNFKKWREEKYGKIDVTSPFLPSIELAEYIGVMLGDGNITRYPRTEGLLIFGNSNNDGFIQRYAELTEKLFKKTPKIRKVKNINCIRISLYQKNISKRLKIPIVDRAHFTLNIPEWIWTKREFIISYLKGLFEAEGSLSVHLPTCTYNFQFANRNAVILESVAKALKILGYHPEIRFRHVRLRKKAEVNSFKNLIKFRLYQ